MKYFSIGTRLLFSNAIENMNNILSCSVEPTRVAFLVLILNIYMLLAVAIILALQTHPVLITRKIIRLLHNFHYHVIHQQAWN